MTAPLYFFPDTVLTDTIDQTKFRPAFLAKFGVEHVFSDVSPTECSRFDLNTAGPGGKSGSMIATNTNGQPPSRVGHYPDFQTWTQVRKDPDLWIGVDNDAPPVPVDFCRPKILPGWEVELADGNQWTVPIIRSVERSGLPYDMYYDVDGEFHVEVAREYQALWKEAEKAWDLVHGYYKSEEGISFKDVLAACLQFLGVNYRVGQYEQTVLRLINTTEEVWLEVLSAVCDMRFLKEVQEVEKKSESPQPEE